MFLLIAVFTGLVFTAVRYADLPVGRVLHAVSIAGPAIWLMRTPPRRIAIFLVLLIGAALVFAEIGPLLAAADYAPVLWFADMALYLDAMLLVAAAFAAVQVRSIGRMLSLSLRRARGLRPVRQRPRGRSSKPRHRKQPPPANDDAPGALIRIAA